jgi:hypothetical protein
MSFLYPRTIAVLRPNSVSPVTVRPASVRSLAYSGETPTSDRVTGESVVFASIPASIQFRSTSMKRDNHLPGDTERPGIWKVFIPKRHAALGSIRNRDIIVDD